MDYGTWARKLKLMRVRVRRRARALRHVVSALRVDQWEEELFFILDADGVLKGLDKDDIGGVASQIAVDLRLHKNAAEVLRASARQVHEDSDYWSDPNAVARALNSAARVLEDMRPE
ncbi:hypothetical protein A5790_05270 [Mycobacterium sp. 852002-51152_SCH6134967]|nr:hypothetical protein A5790_05270 [Mycobacterium sp. 852002-51152_SCH6134967]